MQTPMHAIPVAIALLALSGCSTLPGPGPLSDPDGVACEDSAGASAVWIDVEYSGAAVGTPSATCEVDPNTQITWRGPEGSRQPFRLSFHGDIPTTGRLPEESSESDGRQKIRITANNASGTYEYDILSGDIIVDPAIIIR